jgi:hypothetical protein
MVVSLEVTSKDLCMIWNSCLLGQWLPRTGTTVLTDADGMDGTRYDVNEAGRLVTYASQLKTVN